MRFAVIGAEGQVGQEFTKCIQAEKLRKLRHSDVDVTDARAVHDYVGQFHCDVIINLAAFHNVNQCEEDPSKALQVNALGALNVARAANGAGCKVVYFSSDYVFGMDLERRTPYVENDPPAPLNVYGISKVTGEECVRAAHEDHLIVRSSSLFGVVTSKKGWTFPEMILRRAAKGEPLRVVNDQYMSPTYTADLVRCLLAVLEKNGRGTVHITNEGGCTWYDFATATLRAAGMDCPIEAVGSDAFPSVARRPSYSRLDSERLPGLGVETLRSWEEALAAYLTEKGVIA